MNKVKPSDTGRRGYDSRLRQEQAQLRRQRILDAAVELLAEPGAGAVTLAEVARRAGVSEPTLYRHFGSRERLYEELDAHAQARVGLPAAPIQVGEMPAHVGRLFEMFGRNAALLQAVTRAGLGQEMRRRGRARRTKQLKEVLAAYAPHLDERSLSRVAGVLRVLVSWESFQMFTGDLGLKPREASAAVRWAVEVLLQEVSREDTGVLGGSGGRGRTGARGAER